MLLSCSNDNQNEKLVLNENDSLVFTRYSPEGPSSFTFYKLTNSQVFKDDTSGFVMISQLEANYNENPVNLEDLGSDKFNLTKDLLNYFPSKLLTTVRNIGNPGANDSGVLYVQLSKNGVTKIWELHSDPNDVREEFRVFVQKVNEKINQLQ